MKNFGEFFNNQIENAGTVILSHTTGVADAKLDTCVQLIREHNSAADILTTPWEQLTGAQILEVLEKKNTLEGSKKIDPQLEAVYRGLEEQMKSILGTKVFINPKDEKKGKLEIEYYSQEELDRIIDLIRTVQR
jgi:G3E family GTPase